MRLSIAEATELAATVLSRHGLVPEHARQVAEHLVDSATAGLWSRCVTNALIPNGQLTQRRAGGPSAQRYLEIRFKQVRIVDVSVAMSDENLIPLEKVTLAFESVTLDYTPQAAQGGSQSGRHSFNWVAGTSR